MTYLRHRLSVPLMIERIEERSRVIAGRKNPTTGEAEFLREPDGWWIVMTNGMSFGVGKDKPPFAVGETITLSLTAGTPHVPPSSEAPVVSPKPAPRTDGASEWPDNGAPVRQFVDPSAPLNFTPGSERRGEDA